VCRDIDPPSPAKSLWQMPQPVNSSQKLFQLRQAANLARRAFAPPPQALRRAASHAREDVLEEAVFAPPIQFVKRVNANARKPVGETERAHLQ